MDISSDFVPRQARVTTAQFMAMAPSLLGVCTVATLAACARSADGDRGHAVGDDFSRSVVPQKYFQATNRQSDPCLPPKNNMYSCTPAFSHVLMLPASTWCFITLCPSSVRGQQHKPSS